MRSYATSGGQAGGIPARRCVRRRRRTLADLRHVLDVLLGVGQSRHEHKPHPDLLAGLGQTLSEIDGGLQDAAGDLVIGLLVAGFDVEQAQVDVVEHLVGVIAC